ncbi:hypothetical protein L1889_18400 [Paenalcaligenes niemegkensis]|uniref:hypothetical protein n=1 Tax=Paenalcaligenes niemegkensis TaxID=2895469 RepID=UPI001EE79944|nr:hypothetical protein [Paenalcaligenes niemegkensis]MCQ9618412.1 hypothetical protein [Paenalcaligenes niemegkensis]
MWYRTGTISIAADSPTVTGSGTAWVQNIRVGDGLQGPDGRLYEVTNVASDTALSIRPNYQGPAVSGESYWIIPVQGYTKRLADRAGVLLNEYGGIPDRIDGNEGRIAQNETRIAQNDTRITENDTRIANAIAAMLTKSGNLSGLASTAQSQLNLGVIQSLLGTVLNTDNCTVIANSNGVGVRLVMGVQVCWHTVTMTYTNPSALSANWVYPTAFSAPPVVSGNLIDLPPAGSREGLFVPITPFLGNVGLNCYSNAAWAQGITLSAQAIAIGYW